MTTVYVTKWALTRGIVVMKGKPCTLDKDGFYVRDDLPCNDQVYYPPHWYLTREAAIARAEEMRTKRIASLEKQLVKLRAMTFEVEE